MEQELHIHSSGETYSRSLLGTNVTHLLESKLGNRVTIDGHTTNMFAGIVRLPPANTLYILSGNSVTFKKNPSPWMTKITCPEILDSLTDKRKLRVRIRGDEHTPAFGLLDAMRGWAVMQGAELVV